MKISTILFFCLLMTACMQTKSFHRTNGWYYVTSQTTDSLSQTPFLTVMDFDSSLIPQHYYKIFFLST